ncbi:hypothetical protein ACTNEW_03700 [Blautia sp. HCP3S3_G3]|uniref:hypothetical protein n=1 Tax=Blautia sp. HCP3S3_G3 TaxID=3438913 RepID=UPI003F896A9F
MNNVNKEISDFFQLLKDNGCFHDETKPVDDMFSEIEKKLVFDENDKKNKQV